MKKILIIVGGGISAYKSLDLIRLLKKNSYQVKTILTKSGSEFVTPLSLSTLTGEKTHQDLFDLNEENKIDHIALSRWADLILVIPTTANFMKKLVSGSADDLASTVILASNKIIYLAPAMNVRMWIHPATQLNVKTLIGFGYKFIGPNEGEMACGEYGKGKMSTPDEIFKEIQDYFINLKVFRKNKIKALVTAGPTREYLDPVRYISNESSGKQGIEIAKAFDKAGIKTTLVLGPSAETISKDLNVINVTTADEMISAVKKNLPVDILVCAAAVSDFRPKIKNKNKIKKNDSNFDTIEFVRNPDLLEYLGKMNKNRPRILVGFSAETKDLLKNAQRKLKEKYCDFIIANDVSKKSVGFNSDHNEVYIIDKSGNKKKIRKNKKSFIASIIAESIFEELLNNGKTTN